jgi:hypothetical protein
MLAMQHAARLLAHLAAIAQAADEAMGDVRTLTGAAIAAAGGAGEVARWLPSIEQALERIQLECADLRFCTKELREALPPADSLQPRLL